MCQLFCNDFLFSSFSCYVIQRAEIICVLSTVAELKDRPSQVGYFFGLSELPALLSLLHWLSESVSFVKQILCFFEFSKPGEHEG